MITISDPIHNPPCVSKNYVDSVIDLHIGLK